MKISRQTLIIIAALIWYIGGIILLFKGGHLIYGALELRPLSLWPYAALGSGILLGLIKSKYIFIRSCRENIKRIKKLASPKPWQFYSPGFILFLLIIMPTGAVMSRLAAGNFLWLLIVSVLDLAIATALLTSSYIFWKKETF